MTTALTKLPASAFQLTVTLPWDEVKKTYEEVFNKVAQEVEIEGFRKGKAPREMLEPKIDKGKVYGEVVNRLIPQAYQKALAEHSLKPISAPQIRLTEASENKDWQFTALACEKPKVALEDYKRAVQDINARGKIWTPDAAETIDNSSETKDKKEEGGQKKIEGIVNKLLEVCKVEIAEILAEGEVNRQIAQLIEDVRAAGLTYEQYLASSGQTAETVKLKSRQKIETSLKLEFILEAVADDLGVTVGQEEIEAVISKETDKERQDTLRRESYVLASVLRRDKTLGKLLTLQP